MALTVALHVLRMGNIQDHLLKDGNRFGNENTLHSKIFTATGRGKERIASSLLAWRNTTFLSKIPVCKAGKGLYRGSTFV